MTPSTCARWAHPLPDDPPARAAGVLHRRHMLSLPLDIETLVHQYATVERHEWPFDCDAMTVGLAGPDRPVIFLRKGQPIRRERFTLAHELGHVLLGWHFGRVACHTSRPALLEQTVMETGQAATIRFPDLEREANAFASHLLLPWHLINTLAASEDVSELLQGLEQANLSAEATLIGLTRALQPGFVFRFDTSDGPRTFTSSGTNMPWVPGIDADARGRLLSARCKDTGLTYLSGRLVQWWRLAEFTDMPPMPAATSKVLLDEAVAAAGLDEDGAKARKRSIQATTSGALSTLRGDRAQTLAALRARFAAQDELTDGLDPGPLDAFMVAKVHERFDRLES